MRKFCESSMNRFSIDFSISLAVFARVPGDRLGEGSGTSRISEMMPVAHSPVFSPSSVINTHLQHSASSEAALS